MAHYNPNASYLMLKALLRTQKSTLISTVSHAAVGRNNGGFYLSLYARKDDFRFVGVYEELWYQLPGSLVDIASAYRDKVTVSKEVNRRDADEQAGLLFQIPVEFEVIRYRYGGIDSKAEWGFGGVTAVWKEEKQEEKQEGASDNQNNPIAEEHTALEPLDSIDLSELTYAGEFVDSKAAIAWAHWLGAGELADLKSAFKDLYTDLGSPSAQETYTAWQRYIGLQLYALGKIPVTKKAEAIAWATVFCLGDSEAAEEAYKTVQGAVGKKQGPDLITAFIDSFDPYQKAATDA